MRLVEEMDLFSVENSEFTGGVAENKEIDEKEH